MVDSLLINTGRHFFVAKKNAAAFIARWVRTSKKRQRCLVSPLLGLIV